MVHRKLGRCIQQSEFKKRYWCFDICGILCVIIVLLFLLFLLVNIETLLVLPTQRLSTAIEATESTSTFLNFLPERIQNQRTLDLQISMVTVIPILDRIQNISSI